MLFDFSDTNPIKSFFNEAVGSESDLSDPLANSFLKKTDAEKKALLKGHSVKIANESAVKVKKKI